MKDIKILSKDLAKEKNFNLNIKAEEISYYNFWHYTSLNSLKSILDSKKIKINNISKMNDLDELKLHNNQKSKIHIFCLCNSNSEKIPLWYLYSGIKGDGISLGITRGEMLKLLRSISYLETKDHKRLIKDKDFVLEYGWAYYRKTNDKKRIFYKNNWYLLTDNKPFINNFIKNYPWNYEKEFRIIFITKKDVEELYLDISQFIPKFKVIIGPEMRNENEKKKIVKFLKDKQISKIKCSEIDVNMGLLNRNFNNFIDYLFEFVDESTLEDIRNKHNEVNKK